MKHIGRLIILGLFVLAAIKLAAALFAPETAEPIPITRFQPKAPVAAEPIEPAEPRTRAVVEITETEGGFPWEWVALGVGAMMVWSVTLVIIVTLAVIYIRKISIGEKLKRQSA
jgi:hypothetical protein